VNIEFDLRFIINSLPVALPFGITGIFVTIYLWSPSIWLSIFVGETSVGIFNVAFKLIFALFAISQAINMAFYPLLSRIYVSDPISVQNYFNKHMKIMIVFSIPLTFGTIFLAEDIILFIVGRAFYDSILVLQVIVLIIPLVFIRSTFEQILIVSSNQRLVTRAYGYGMGIGIISAIILINFIDILGASSSLLLADILISIVLLFYVIKNYNKLNFKDRLKDIIRSTLSSFIMLFFIYISTSLINFLPYKVFIGILIFLISFIIIGGFDNSDIDFIYAKNDFRINK